VLGLSGLRLLQRAGLLLLLALQLLPSRPAAVVPADPCRSILD
jgi:hypothetical protein